MSLMSLEKVDIVFGAHPESVFSLIDTEENRESIRKKTGHIVAVRQASCNLEEGEIIVFMGLSGSGKSSLLRTFNGLNPISRGDIYFKNQKITDFKSLRLNQISMVFQSPALLAWRNVFDNVALGLEIQNLDTHSIQKRVFDTLEHVGLKNWAYNFPQELSGGMQQRIGLARALATESPILLMDEPFSALDPLMKAEFQQELLRLQKNLKKSILFVSHDFNEALTLGNRIAILEEGRIVQIGTPQEIFSNPANKHIERFISNAQQHCSHCNSKIDSCKQ